MSAGELVVILAAFALLIGFAALIVVLLRVHDTLTDLRREVVELREQTSPLISELKNSADEARHDLDRFDKVLGSAEAIGDAVGSTVARSTFSAPAIKAAGLARGMSRTVSRLRGTQRNQTDNVIDVTNAPSRLSTRSAGERGIDDDRKRA